LAFEDIDRRAIGDTLEDLPPKIHLMPPPLRRFIAAAENEMQQGGYSNPAATVESAKTSLIDLFGSLYRAAA